MALLALLVSRLAGVTALTTRLAAKIVGEPMRYLAGKAFERKLLVYKLPFRRLALANDPEIAETVLIDRHGTFPKSDVVTALLQPMIGAGVFGQPGGEDVRLKRRLFIQALARSDDADVSRIADTLTAAYLARWRAAGNDVVVPRELSRLTVDIVAQAMLGHRFSPEESVRFVDLFFAYHQRAAPVLLMLGRRSPGSMHKIVHQLGLEEIGATMRSLIEARFLAPIEAGEPAARQAPFAKSLLDAAAGPRQALLDEIAVMLLAGHETTASTLSWLLWQWAGCQEQQDGVAALLTGQAPLGAAAAAWHNNTPAAVRAALIDETLRLYPPIAFFLRETTSDLTLRDKPLAAGDFVVAAPWTLQRHISRWPDADRFDPQRWLSGAQRPSATAFLPFGFGARSCPGQRFAYLEMHAILQRLLTRCRFVRLAEPAPSPLGSLTSRPDREFRLRVEYREP
jgi:cytochrome P450